MRAGNEAGVNGIFECSWSKSGMRTHASRVEPRARLVPMYNLVVHRDVFAFPHKFGGGSLEDDSTGNDLNTAKILG